MIFPPIAAWIETSYSWRGMIAFNFSVSRRPWDWALLRWVISERASTGSPATSTSSLTSSPSRHPILDRRRRRDQVELELALQALLDDLEMQQPEEAAAKAEAEGGGVLGLVRERGVVQLQLLQGLLQVDELFGVARKQAGEDHRL